MLDEEKKAAPSFVAEKRHTDDDGGGGDTPISADSQPRRLFHLDEETRRQARNVLPQTGKPVKRPPTTATKAKRASSTCCPKAKSENSVSNLKASELPRDSLESVRSKFSTSSANDELFVESPQPQESLFSPPSVCKTIAQTECNNNIKPQVGAVANLSPFQKQEVQIKRPGVYSVSLRVGCEKEPVEERRRNLEEADEANKSVGEQRRQVGAKQEPPFLFAGIVFSVLGSLFFSLSVLCIKLLPGSGENANDLRDKTMAVCLRGIFIMFFCGTAILVTKSTFLVQRNEIWVNALRAIFGFTGVYGSYISLKYISMGDSTALVFSSPLWTSLLSHFILNEPLHKILFLALPASLVGILLIAHPATIVGLATQFGGQNLDETSKLSDENNSNSTQETFETKVASFVELAEATTSIDLIDDDYDNQTPPRWPGIVIALGTSLIVSFVYIVLKFRKTTPIQTTTFWLGFVTFAAALVVMCSIGFGHWPATYFEWTLLFGNGLFSWLGQSLLQLGLFYEDASVLSVVRTLDVAMTFALSALFLDEQIMWTSVVGATIIACVVVSMMLNNWLQRLMCPTGCLWRRQIATEEDNTNSIGEAKKITSEKSVAANEAFGAKGAAQLHHLHVLGANAGPLQVAA